MNRGYIHFCVDTVVPEKTLKIYPNNKEYFTPEIKRCIRRRNKAFKVERNSKEIEGSERDAVRGMINLSLDKREIQG